MNLQNILGNILTIPAKPRKDNEAFVKTVREKQQPSGWGGMADIALFGSGNKELSVVVDPFSGKYYGEGSRTEYTSHYEQQIKGLQQNIQYIQKNGRLPPSANKPDFSNGISPMAFANSNMSYLPLTAEAKEKQIKSYQEQIAQSTKELENFKTNYVQQADMMKSFNKYGANWNKYFEGSYKNPRIAEAQASQVNPNSQQAQAQDTPARNNLRIPKAVGTGVASTGSLNPFGRLDSGLNI